jgi:hypothetical protein
LLLLWAKRASSSVLVLSGRPLSSSMVNTASFSRDSYTGTHGYTHIGTVIFGKQTSTPSALWERASTLQILRRIRHGGCHGAGPR